MGWEDNINKQNIIDRVLEAFEKVVSHPNFNHDENFMWTSNRYHVRQVYLRVADGLPLLKAIRVIYRLEYPSGQNDFRNREEEILEDLAVDLATLARIRAEGWLETIMGTYSDRITNQEILSSRVVFEYDRLNYNINRTSVRISNGRFQIDICILPTDDTLPFHDHVVNVFLAILNSPEGLDVLNFGMRLADIFRRNNINNLISIFSPFNKSNHENRDFMGMLHNFKLRVESYPLVYKDINELYKEIFGLYWEDS